MVYCITLMIPSLATFLFNSLTVQTQFMWPRPSQFDNEGLQSMTIILDCRDGLDSETFHNDIFFTTVTAAVAEIPLYYKKMYFLKIIVNVFERVHILQC